MAKIGIGKVSGCGTWIFLAAALYFVAPLILCVPTEISDTDSDECPLDELCSRDLPSSHVEELAAALSGTANGIAHSEGGPIAEPLSRIQCVQLIKQEMQSGTRHLPETFGREHKPSTEYTLEFEYDHHRESNEKDASERMADQLGYGTCGDLLL